MGEKLEVDVLKSILSDFTPRMGSKWAFIGIQLRQGSLVQDLRSSSELGRDKVQHIIDEWLEGDHKDVPVCAETIAEVLRSPAVKLGAVAKDFENKCADKLQKQIKKASQHPHEPPHPGPHPPAGATVSNLESGVSDVDGQPPPSSNPHPQPSASLDPGGLVVPEQVEDGRENIPSLEKDGGVPVEGVGSPVEESGKERGQPPPGDLQRGSEHDGDVEPDGPIPADVLDATGRRTTETSDREEDKAICEAPEVAMVDSVGQRCVSFLDLLNAAAATCRIWWTGDQTYYGSGSFVVDAPHYILLTCCHNFLTEKETEELQIMTPASLKEKLTANCKKATYEISDPTTFQTTAKAASDVLLDFDNPRLYIVQSRDLLAIRVKDPASFGFSKAIPLRPEVNRETELLPGAKLFSLVQFPYNKHKAPRPLEIAIGLKYKEPYNQDVVKYEVDAYKGSSGSPLLYSVGKRTPDSRDEGIVLMAVHLRGGTREGTDTPVCNMGSIITKTFLSGLKKALYD